MHIKVMSAGGVPRLSYTVSKGKHQDIYFDVTDSYREYRLMFQDAKKTELLLTSDDMLTYGEVKVKYQDGVTEMSKILEPVKHVPPGLFDRIIDSLCLVFCK